MLDHAFGRLEWPPPLRQGAAVLASRLVHHLEPALHLERLEAMPVLLVNDFDDHLVPRPCIEALRRAAPAATTFHLVESGHVRPGNAELIAEMTELVFAWSDAVATRAGAGNRGRAGHRIPSIHQHLHQAALNIVDLQREPYRSHVKRAAVEPPRPVSRAT